MPDVILLCGEMVVIGAVATFGLGVLGSLICAGVRAFRVFLS